MEAEAVSLGIQVAQQIKCLPLVIESDSKEVVDLSCNRKSSKLEIFWIIETIQANLKNLNQSKIQFVPRVCNVVAHSLAKIALNYNTRVVWLESFPADIMFCLCEVS